MKEGKTEVKKDATAEVEVTNDYDLQTIDIPVEKKWNDKNYEKLRPTNVIFVLLANGDRTGKTVTVDANSQWKGVFKDLPLFQDEEPITYTIEEIVLPGYTSETSGNANDGFTVTNTFITVYGQVDIPVKKIWEDDGNKWDKRPSDITVKLFADGEYTGKSAKLNDGNKWFYIFEKMPEERVTYDGKRVKIVYTIEEVKIENYDSAIESDGAGGFTITNTLNDIFGKVDIPVTKIWKDDNDKAKLRPDSITVKLYADGKYTGKKAKLSEKNKWKYFFEGMPEKTAEGKTIKYTVEEKTVKNYKTKIEGNAQTGFTITNTVIPGKDTKTGDATRLGLLLALMAAAGIGGGTALVGRRRRKE